jgi:heme oxygenase
MARLREETKAHHDATEQVPYSQAIVAERLGLESYVAHLQALAAIHEVLETRLAEATHPTIVAVWHDGLRKLAAIHQDLAYFAARGSVSLRHSKANFEAAAAVTVSFLDWLEGLACDQPVALLGVLYVFEGSMMGSTVLRKHLAKSLDLDAERGLAYHSLYGREVRLRFMDFRARMDASVQDSTDIREITSAASETFDRVGALLRCLHG